MRKVLTWTVVALACALFALPGPDAFAKEVTKTFRLSSYRNKKVEFIRDILDFTEPGWREKSRTERMSREMNLALFIDSLGIRSKARRGTPTGTIEARRPNRWEVVVKATVITPDD